MGNKLYKSFYVLAAKREDGTYGIIRDSACDTIQRFDTPEEAEIGVTGSVWREKAVVVDIGLLVDPDLRKRKYRIKKDEIDISNRLTRR